MMLVEFKENTYLTMAYLLITNRMIRENEKLLYFYLL